MRNEELSARHIVLLGIGHTNAHVLRMWRMNPIRDTDLTCISDHGIATYSGMLPAVLAGQIPEQSMQIDLVRLCAASGARLITDRVIGIDHDHREILFQNRPSIGFDALSIGIGSTATTEGVTVEGDSFVPIKPMQTFLARLRQALASAENRGVRDSLRVVVVGSGVAGIEIACCLPNFLESASSLPFSINLITRSDNILPDLSAPARDRISKVLAKREVTMSTGQAVRNVTSDSVVLTGGSEIGADLVVWATGASPPSLLGQLGMALDDRGFLATNHELQSVSAPNVFAVGDSGTIVDEALPKAGVYAVRQGPILWENLDRTLRGVPLRKYEPQRSFLKLVNLGDGRAVGQWKGFAFEGRWAMRLKDSIDSGFMEKFQVDSLIEEMNESDEAEMQCRGCGCKLAAGVLETALDGAAQIQLEDAAEIGGEGSTQLIASTDFFSSPVDDAFLAGRIAALHSASDILACGAAPTEALANVVLPEGDQRAQQRILHDLLSGARREFDTMGASIVGGHTIVGPRMEVGFTVIGKTLGENPIRKRNLKPGDALYLTKALGIGVLLAAHMRSMCPAPAYQALIKAMFEPQHRFSQIAVDSGVKAGTDVTGFGLMGHLIEMLTTSHVSAVLDLNRVPVLFGAMELIEQGIESSLAPENKKLARQVEASTELWDQARFKVLFDPQTCGGLLLGLGESVREKFVEAVVDANLPEPICIGRVTDKGTSGKPVEIRST